MEVESLTHPHRDHLPQLHRPVNELTEVAGLGEDFTHSRANCPGPCRFSEAGAVVHMLTFCFFGILLTLTPDTLGPFQSQGSE